MTDIENAIKYYKSMIFPSDISETTLNAISMNKLAISALEKQIPKSVSFDINNHNNVYCYCGKNVRDLKDFYDNNFCIKCGRALKW